MADDGYASDASTCKPAFEPVAAAVVDAASSAPVQNTEGFWWAKPLKDFFGQMIADQCRPLKFFSGCTGLFSEGFSMTAGRVRT